MDIFEYDDEIARLWPQPGQSPTKELVDLCLSAVADYPEESVFWYDLGIIMQRIADEYSYTPDDYLRCFENAVRYDQENVEAYQELGYVLDVFFDDYDRAEKAFKKAIELGAEQESYCGLARVLAQMGKIDDALVGMSESICPFHDHPDVRHLRDEILAGSWYWEKNEK